MRILQIVTVLGRGGAEVLAVELAKQFLEMGHETEIVSITTARHLRQDPSHEAGMMNQLNEAGVKWSTLGQPSRRNLISGWLAMRRVTRRFKPDVILAHTATGILTTIGSPARKVFTFHTTHVDFPPILFRLFDRLVHHYVAVGPTCRKFLAGHVRGEIAQITNAAPEPMTIHPGRSPEHVTFVSVANLSPAKNYDGMIVAFERALKKSRSGSLMRLVAAGGGARLQEFRARAPKIGRGDQVTFCGPTDGAASILAKADVFCSASLWEGLPISLIEAAQAGLPIIATNVGDTPLVVRNGENGFVVEPGDTDGLVNAMRILADDESLRARMGRASLEVAKQFSIQKCANSYLELFGNLLNLRQRHNSAKPVLPLNLPEDGLDTPMQRQKVWIS